LNALVRRRIEGRIALKLKRDLEATVHSEALATLPAPVSVLPKSRWLWLAPALLSVFYLVSAFVFIPRTGLQNDELFFVGPIFYPDTTFYRIAIGSARIPLMVMSYSGALKTWLYAALFRIFEPNVWSVRLPMALVGVTTIWLTWAWVRRIAGSRAALIAIALLATDTLFLLTGIFDWGPVALQHLLLMAGLVCVQRWIATESRPWLALGFLLWGLGTWDKALLSWPLVGLAVASLVVYPGVIRRKLRLPAVLIALTAFFLGMLPLVLYNVNTRGETAAENAKFSTESIRNKAELLLETIDGSSLFGYIVQADSLSDQHVPQSPAARQAIRIARLAGPHNSNWMIPAWIVGIAGLVALWRTAAWRPLLFVWIAIIVTWLQMAFTKGAGSGAHHAILLWPLTCVFLGIALAGIADRIPRHGPALVAAALGILVAGNLLTTNEYLTQLLEHGGSGGWTDAIYPLSSSLDNAGSEWIGLVDWGYLNQLEALHGGRLHLFVVDLAAPASEIKHMVSSPEILFIQHTAGKQMYPGINDRFRDIAQRQGYVERVERTIDDSRGRPVFELFRFQEQP
jgi:4-amino-4-deoxy-L-arabinose transferase-like glycosyltransferase